jgi:hypothetical protein
MGGESRRRRAAISSTPWSVWLLAAAPLAARAQAISAPASVDSVEPVDRRGALGLEVWAATAHTSARLGFLGTAPDLGLTLGAIRVTRTLHRTPRVAFDYAVDFVPVAHLTRRVVTIGSRTRIVCRRTETCRSVDDDILLKGSADGVGVSPLGLTAVLRPTRALEVGFGGTGGVMWFDERVPTSGAAQLNFTATAEAGVGLIDRRGIGPFLMYRFHHISNGGRASENSAIASHLVSLGMRWRLSSGAAAR